jgi:hypothetical protein
LISGICPDRLKYAIIKPCFKKISNYRPISLLTGFSKIFELRIFHRLKQHLVSNNILVIEQCGFRDNVSTESTIFKLIESIFSAWNNKELITSIFCDLTRAFDCVSHQLLSSKLEFFGVKSPILSWLKSYLYIRKQKVELQFFSSPNILSNWEIVRHSVPQGSVLTPLLFNVYINDFPCIINKVSDILISSNNFTELNSKLNALLHCISRWFQNNQLVLNLSKTHLVKFASSKSPSYPLHVSYNKQAISVTANIKFLGLYLDCHLTWKSRINNLIKKLNSICFMLKKLLFFVNAEMLQMAYFAQFHSQISYGIIFWGSSSSMKYVFIIQKTAIRIMLRLGPRSSCREVFKKLDVLTVPCLYIYALMLFVV